MNRTVTLTHRKLWERSLSAGGRGGRLAAAAGCPRPPRPRDCRPRPAAAPAEGRVTPGAPPPPPPPPTRGLPRHRRSSGYASRIVCKLMKLAISKKNTFVHLWIMTILLDICSLTFTAKSDITMPPSRGWHVMIFRAGPHHYDKCRVI